MQLIKKTNKSQSIRVQAKGGLSESEIDALIKEAEINKEADAKKREVLDAKNNAESTLNKIDTSLAQWRESMSKPDLDSLNNAMNDVRALLSNDNSDPSAIVEASKKLDEVSLAVFERAYNSKGTNQNQNENPNPNSTEGDTKQ